MEKIATKKEGNKLLFLSIVERTKNNGLKLHQGNFSLTLGKAFLSVKTDCLGWPWSPHAGSF